MCPLVNPAALFTLRLPCPHRKTLWPPAAAGIDARPDADGWRIDACITAAALPGWDPIETPRLGFFAAVIDRRLGRIPLFAPPEFPWDSDPTTWAELDLHSP